MSARSIPSVAFACALAVACTHTPPPEEQRPTLDRASGAGESSEPPRPASPAVRADEHRDIAERTNAPPDELADAPDTNGTAQNAPSADAPAPTPAPPRPEIPDELARSLRFELVDRELSVTDGTRRAPVDGIIATHLEKQGRKHTVEHGWQYSVTHWNENTCSMRFHNEVYSAHSLVARLENTAALALHRRKDYKASAKGFARATALDPDFDLAWTNLASAYALLGQREAAIAALAPVIRKDPARVYYKVNIDPELATLRDAPALLALHTPRPGNASFKLAKRQIQGFEVAFSPSTNTLAVPRSEGNLGCGATDELLFFDAKTGEERSRVVLVRWSETEHGCEDDEYIAPRHVRNVRRRIQAANKTLAHLGFSVSPGLEIMEMEEKHDALVSVTFPKVKIALVTRDGTARVVRRDEVLGEAQGIPYATPLRGIHDPDARVVVFRWLSSFPEGCNSEHDDAGVNVIPLRSVAPGDRL